ncbi:hypothetical protein [Acidiphilium acidophilum]|uniref:hypothetical protein n=1 Tax=Acidiphilium acidophilum TaxID=76588 RepID=UPI002E8E70AF|nr:hypothetical protein [Acidiphilium acidophilum]
MPPVRPMPHPGQMLIPVDAPNDMTSFTDDAIGSFYSMYVGHWDKLFYLGEFHRDLLGRPLAFEQADPAPFSDAFQAWAVLIEDFTLQILRFDVGRGQDLIGYRFLSSGPIGVDVRLTAPDLGTAAARLLRLRSARVRPNPPVPARRVKWEAALREIDRSPRRIGPYAPLLTLTQATERPAVVWMRRFIRDPYMMTVREMRNGSCNVVVHGFDVMQFDVASRQEGLERIDTLFDKLVIRK